MFFGQSAWIRTDRLIQWMCHSVVTLIDLMIENSVSEWYNSALPQHQSFGLSENYTEIILSEFYEDKLEEKLKEVHQSAIGKELEHEK